MAYERNLLLITNHIGRKTVTIVAFCGK